MSTAPALFPCEHCGEPLIPRKTRRGIRWVHESTQLGICTRSDLSPEDRAAYERQLAEDARERDRIPDEVVGRDADYEARQHDLPRYERSGDWS